ncbi:hypothetical protein AXF42_Ash010895 [Apostasia shenzhenica]|uniref:Uncharacterized protein n=1 Tax=Apostasia shenzhenica TaxID=1088818 RepID=A0A2I0A0Y5_9ASPA|nr:hypothetical protein AXF42_Ash010895 [Apostasia shenzhenica]
MSPRVFVLRHVTFSASAIRVHPFLVRLGGLAYVDSARASTWTVQMKKRGSNCNNDYNDFFVGREEIRTGVSSNTKSIMCKAVIRI